MTSLSPNAFSRCPGEYPRLGTLISYLDSLTARAELDVLASLLSRLEVGLADISPACIFGQKGYRRNTIRATEWYELLALCWHSGDRTPIHDHRGVSCAFRVVEGTGTEIRFRNTASGLICPTVSVEMPPGYICAANDADIHEVANMQAPGTDLITLHIYSPPIKQMTTYDFAAPVPEECRSSYVKSAHAGEIPC